MSEIHPIAMLKTKFCEQKEINLKVNLKRTYLVAKENFVKTFKKLLILILKKLVQYYQVFKLFLIRTT